MYKKYLIKLKLANKMPFNQKQLAIMKKEFDLVEGNSADSANPKKVTDFCYLSDEDAVEVTLESQVALDSPGRSLSAYSRRLMKYYFEYFKEGKVGKSLFNIEAVDLSDDEDGYSIQSNSQLLKIIIDLIMESEDVKDRHKRDTIIEKIKKTLEHDDYVKERYKDI
ncbi:MAG: hypothetical protein IJX85_06975 [Lachnospiraceae bacterium]|nr:hypothetical protein [Lachnospiraceae bacterium]